MYVCCEAKCVVLELTFVKTCLLFFCIWQLQKEKNECKKEYVRKERKEKKNRVTHCKKSSSSPLFYPLFLFYFFTHILQNFCSKLSSYSLVFSLFNLLPLECVLLKKSANRIWYQSLVQINILGRNLKSKKRIS
jgi:hypothetical protein